MPNASNERFTIRELAAIAGVTPRTIRYYVSEGLLPPPGGAGQHRTYTEGHVLRLQAIRRLKELYLPLAEIRRRLDRLSPDDLRRAIATGETEKSATADEVEEIVKRIATLASGSLSLGAPGAPDSPTNLAALLRRGDSPRMLLGEAESSTSYVVPRSSMSPASGQGDVASDPLWRRVTLGPGVELHFQVPSDRRREAAIRRLIDIAGSLLGGL